MQVTEFPSKPLDRRAAATHLVPVAIPDGPRIIHAEEMNKPYRIYHQGMKDGDALEVAVESMIDKSRVRAGRLLVFAGAMLCASRAAQGQLISGEAEKPWQPPSGFASKQREAAEQDRRTQIEAVHRYSLSELVDLAERYNPSTRAAWENARAAAARLGIARSDLLPALNAVALTNTTRVGILFDDVFVQQTLGVFQPMLQLNYLIFDFGARSARIDEARQRLFGANLTFNRMLLDLLFETMRRYYELLNAMGQRDAAQVNYDNADTVRKAVDARLTVGLATLPDALEARAAAAQANFTLQTAIGDVDIRRGDLLSLLGAAPSEHLQVQPLAEIPTPARLDIDVHEATERSLSLRPEIGEQTAEREAARAEIRAARSAFLPTLQSQGQVGEYRTYGKQDLFPAAYAGPQGEWNVNVSVEWDLFDGGRRSNQLAEAHANERRAQAQIDQTRDEVEQQVWTAYVTVRTAFYQRDAAAALLASSQSSYDAALRSYQLGLRSTVDVVSAQRILAQALSSDVAARTTLLKGLADFAYRTGDLLQSASGKSHP
jgi:outer membrane protein